MVVKIAHYYGIKYFPWAGIAFEVSTNAQLFKGYGSGS